MREEIRNRTGKIRQPIVADRVVIGGQYGDTSRCRSEHPHQPPRHDARDIRTSRSVRVFGTTLVAGSIRKCPAAIEFRVYSKRGRDFPDHPNGLTTPCRTLHEFTVDEFFWGHRCDCGVHVNDSCHEGGLRSIYHKRFDRPQPFAETEVVTLKRLRLPRISHGFEIPSRNSQNAGSHKPHTISTGLPAGRRWSF